MTKSLKNTTVKTPQEIVKNIYSMFTKTDKLAFMSSFIFWMIAHLFIFVNDFFVYDSVSLFDSSLGIQNGRFLIRPILTLFANCQIPLLVGISAGIFVGLSVMFMCRIFKMTKPFYVLILSATVTTFPVLYNTNAFLSSAHVFVFSMLFSVLAVYYANKDTLFGYIISAICLIISLSCYQAYMPFAVTLFLFSVILDTLENKKVSNLVKRVLITGIVFMVATALYYLIWRLLLNVFNLQANDYRGESITMSSLFSLDIITRLIQSYILGFYMMFKGMFYRGSLFLMSVGKIVKPCIAIFSVLLVFVFSKARKTKFNNIIFTCLVLLGLPLSVGLIYVFSPLTPHTLMQFPAIIVYLMAIVLTERLIDNKENLHKILEWIVVLLLVISVFVNVVLGNAGYSIMSSSSKSAISFATRVTERVESTAGVDVGTKVCFVSDEHWFYSIREREEHYDGDMLSDKESFVSFTVVSLIGTPYVEALINYINDNANYMELEYSYQDLQDGDYANNKQVQQLQPFPAKNCSVWVNDVLVVKL